MSEVSVEDGQAKEAVALTEDQEKNKHILLTLLEDKGIDLEGDFGIGSFLSMFKAMSDPEFMAEVFQTIGDMSADGDEGVKVIAGLLGAAEDVNNKAATVEPESPEVEVADVDVTEAVPTEGNNNQDGVGTTKDLGGVDGTAVTYITPDKPADVQVEGTSVVKDAMEDGSTVVAGSFNNNVAAEGAQVNATVDQDVVASAEVSAPLDFTVTGQQNTNSM
ncbi:MAG: hypothetical protein ACRBB3_07510 [Alphaproteobacteria bacterium]